MAQAEGIPLGFKSSVGERRKQVRAFEDEMVGLEYESKGNWNATEHDVREMDLFGIQPTFKRRFKFIAMVGFASTVVMCWQNTLATFSFALTNGGTGGYFFTYIYALFAFAFVYLSLAELSSSYVFDRVLQQTWRLRLTRCVTGTQQLEASTRQVPVTVQIVPHFWRNC